MQHAIYYHSPLIEFAVRLMCANRLYNMGVISTKKSLVLLEKLSTSSFCRRRLSVVMVRLKMAETLREACTFIEQVCCSRTRPPPMLTVTIIFCCRKSGHNNLAG